MREFRAQNGHARRAPALHSPRRTTGIAPILARKRQPRADGALGRWPARRAALWPPTRRRCVVPVRTRAARQLRCVRARAHQYAAADAPQVQSGRDRSQLSARRVTVTVRTCILGCAWRTRSGLRPRAAVKPNQTGGLSHTSANPPRGRARVFKVCKIRRDGRRPARVRSEPLAGRGKDRYLALLSSRFGVYG